MSATKVIRVHIAITALEGDDRINWEFDTPEGWVGKEYNSPAEALRGVGEAISDLLGNTVSRVPVLVDPSAANIEAYKAAQESKDEAN